MKKRILRSVILAALPVVFSGCSFAGIARGGLCAAGLLFFFLLTTVFLLSRESEKQ